VPLIIHTVERIQDTPPEAQTYTITEKDTTDVAEIQYKARYGVEPVEAWQWSNYLYIPAPAGKEVKK
jgi:hypothetical protein